jgi:DNA polymerase-3 subunit epsilon
MPARGRFALTLALLAGGVLGWVALTAWVLWRDLSEAQQEALAAMLEPRAPLLLLAAAALAFLLGVLLQRWFAAYPLAARRLSEQVRDIHAVDTDSRIEPHGGPEMQQLAGAVNAFAVVHRTLRRSVEARVQESNARLVQQKNRLAALMSQLAQSVLVCNAEGRILLYNARATELLAGDAEGTPVGLGRSIFGMLDRSLVVHALDRIRDRLAQHEADPVAQFVTARAGLLLRGQMAPVLDASDGLGGFVLVLDDITRTVEAAGQRDFLLQQLTEHTRASLANIRAAVETVQQYPDMEPQRRARFTEVIRAEAERLSMRLDDTLSRHPDSLRAQWPLEDMLAADLVTALQRNLVSTVGVDVERIEAAPGLWLSVDSYSLVQALSHVVAQVAARFGTRVLSIDAVAEGRLARLSLHWTGPPVDPALVHEWEAQPFAVGAHGQGPTLSDVLERHGGELWCRGEGGATGPRADDPAALPPSQRNRLCVELPVTQAPQIAAPAQAARSRPVYYDFDLFSQPGQTPEVDERPLSELAYTVFDTETTGLSPSDGDEIISIGAVRIFNRRLLENERYEQLVNPGRPVRRQAREVHGLTDEVLAGQPGIEAVLPVFHRFAEDTVLVAHNAAFDMRFLQLKEALTGVRFIQPVLDTLLLSALAHPGHSDADHRLEAIAARLGVPVVGRHTALGDAMVTGEVFLKLIPLLEERGIRTLREAREASQKTLYAKLEY